MSVPAIVIENIHRSFGGKKILRGISGSVDSGRVVGLLGWCVELSPEAQGRSCRRLLAVQDVPVVRAYRR